MYLDDLKPLQHFTSYGSIGLHGCLGYEKVNLVTVAGQDYQHAISAHAPSTISYDLGGSYDTFQAEVAINDDVPSHFPVAISFYVIVDDVVKASFLDVSAGEAPKRFSVYVTGAQTLTLKTETCSEEYAHAVWLNPQVVTSGSNVLKGSVAPAPKKCRFWEAIKRFFANILDIYASDDYENECCVEAAKKSTIIAVSKINGEEIFEISPGEIVTIALEHEDGEWLSPPVPSLEFIGPSLEVFLDLAAEFSNTKFSLRVKCLDEVEDGLPLTATVVYSRKGIGV